MKYHIAYAVIAVITVIGHLISVIWTDIMYWLPEYIWFASIVFSVLAIYAGIVTATKSEPDKRGAAIATAVIGAIVLLGLIYSGVSWLFMPENGFETLASLR